MCDEVITPMKKLHSWMYTLLYPAVLGALLFSFVSSLAVADPKPDAYSIGFAAFLILYFSSQHIENTLDYAGYRWQMFIADALELVAMFAFYILLGIVDTKYKIDGDLKYSWGHFFIVLGLVFLLPVAARWLVHKNPFHKWRDGWLSILSISAALISFSGLCFGVNTALLVLLFLVLLIYFALFVSGIVK